MMMALRLGTRLMLKKDGIRMRCHRKWRVGTSMSENAVPELVGLFIVEGGKRLPAGRRDQRL